MSAEYAQVQLIDVLETVEEFGQASLELIAWEFAVEPPELWPLWRDAVSEQLLEFAENDPAGEKFYTLTALGVERLRTLQRRMAS